MQKVRNNIFYDLEGPVSPQDNMREVFVTKVKEGGRLYSVLSRYDDLQALANREGYEPGDTLALAVPFLIEAGVSSKDILDVSARASLVPGIPEFFAELQAEGCWIWVISTSVEHHASLVAKRAGLPLGHTYCTEFPIDFLGSGIKRDELTLVREVREKAVNLCREDLETGATDEAVLKLLNSFYWGELPRTELGRAIATIQVMGGRRKVQALQKAIRSSGGYFLSDAFVVVDSITDWRMAQAVEAAGGIALAWNAKWYCLPWCSCGVAALDARDVRPLFRAWQEGGRAAVRRFVESAPEPKDPEKGPYYDWIAGCEERFQRDVLAVHNRFRTISRGIETAKLG